MKQTSIEINTIFGALTRPAMTAGVTFEYHCINLMVSMLLFIMLDNVLYGLIFFPIHVFGWVVCQYDNQFFSVAAKALSMPNNPNKSLWGVKTYEPY